MRRQRNARKRRPPKRAPLGAVAGGRRSAAHRHLHGAQVAGQEGGRPTRPPLPL